VITLLMIIHILVCFFLIFIVLIQSSKGAELGAAFGGSSQTLFGSRGAATLFSKLTTISAVVFMLTSLFLSMADIKSGSVIKKTVPIEQKAGTPAQQGPLQSPNRTGPGSATECAGAPACEIARLKFLWGID